MYSVFIGISLLSDTSISIHFLSCLSHSGHCHLSSRRRGKSPSPSDPFCPIIRSQSFPPPDQSTYHESLTSITHYFFPMHRYMLSSNPIYLSSCHLWSSRAAVGQASFYFAVVLAMVVCPLRFCIPFELYYPYIHFITGP